MGRRFRRILSFGVQGSIVIVYLLICLIVFIQAGRIVVSSPHSYIFEMGSKGIEIDVACGSGWQRYWTLAIPTWVPLALLNVPMLIASVRFYLRTRDRRRRVSRRVRGRCTRCGYDLRATPTRCPECGLAVSQ